MPTKSKLLFVFFAVFAAINLMLFSLVYLAGRFSFSPKIVVPAIVFWFAAGITIGLLLNRTLQSYGVVAVMTLGLMASMGGAAFFMDAFGLMTGRHAKDARVAEAIHYADAAVIYFKDGRFEPDCVGEYEDSDEDSRTTYFAVPYVPEGWSRTEPVTVWSVCRHDKANCLNGTGIAMIAKHYTAGVTEAEKKCGLKSDPKALRIEWIASPEEEIKWGKKYLAIIIAGVNALWVLVFPGIVISLYRKNRDRV
jgi:hypothetical protein